MSAGRKPRRRRARGALSVIAALLIGSALLRIATGAGAALARDDNASAALSPAAIACPAPEDMGPLLEAMQGRETRVAQREAHVADRLQALAIAEGEIAAKTAELVAAEQSLRATLALVDTAAEDDVTRLVNVYQAMKPKDAAALFETMAPEFSAGFLARMTPEAAAGILSGLSPQAAYTISVILAGRNAAVPRE